MSFTVREDNRLLVAKSDGTPVATDVLEGDELEAVGVLRAFVQAWQDPGDKAYETAIKIALDHASDDEIEALKPGVFLWESGQKVLVDQARLYGGQIYVCVQEHVTQDDWAPPSTPALWRKHTRTTEGAEVAEWVQPQGAHDAYKLGDRVTHQDKTYQSTLDGNVWAPGVHGWKEI